jgi:hypothetical protein
MQVWNIFLNQMTVLLFFFKLQIIKVNVIQYHMLTHCVTGADVYKCKNDTCWNILGMGGRGVKGGWWRG